jgi:AcrR family transcriptional regulator
MEENIKDPKHRIFDAAVELFALNGFNAVGVREISAAADVNISMISYYFGNKIGIFKAIIKRYFELIGQIKNEPIPDNISKEETFKIKIRKFLDIARNQTNLCRIVMMEHNHDIPEIMEYKKQMLQDHLQLIRQDEAEKKPFIGNPNQYLIIGPMVLSMIYSNFLFGDYIKQILPADFDDKFYEDYVNIITTLFFHGISAVRAEYFNEINMKNNN